MQDAATVTDTIDAIGRTVGLLEASGVENHTLIGVLSGALAARIEYETPELQAAIKAMLVSKFRAL